MFRRPLIGYAALIAGITSVFIFIYLLPTAIEQTIIKDQTLYSTMLYIQMVWITASALVMLSMIFNRRFIWLNATAIVLYILLNIVSIKNLVINDTGQFTLQWWHYAAIIILYMAWPFICTLEFIFSLKAKR